MVIKFYSSGFDVLDNFSAHSIIVDGIRYPTVEHAYQALKCLDENGREAIKNSISPTNAKYLSNIVYAEYKDPNWDQIKLRVMAQLFNLKFDQHEDIQDALAATGSEDIQENSPYDSFWGSGADGLGANHIGKIWMKIRDEKLSLTLCGPPPL